MTPVIVFTTFETSFDAVSVARDLVEQRLCACVNIIDKVRSIYRWQGTVHDEGEQLLLMKTVAEKVDALREALSTKHPYEVPEFVVVRMDEVSAPYREWLEAAVE